MPDGAHELRRAGGVRRVGGGGSAGDVPFAAVLVDDLRGWLGANPICCFISFEELSGNCKDEPTPSTG